MAHAPDHVISQIIAHQLGIPTRLVEEPLDPVGPSLTDLVGHMPERVDQQAVDLYDDAAVHNPAKTYGVSTQALTIKLVRLGFIS